MFLTQGFFYRKTEPVVEERAGRNDPDSTRSNRISQARNREVNGHLPYEKQQEFLWELGEVKIGVGTLVKTNQRISQAIKKSVTELNNWVISSHWTLDKIKESSRI